MKRLACNTSSEVKACSERHGNLISRLKGSSKAEGQLDTRRASPCIPRELPSIAGSSDQCVGRSKDAVVHISNGRARSLDTVFVGCEFEPDDVLGGRCREDAFCIRLNPIQALYRNVVAFRIASTVFERTRGRDAFDSETYSASTQVRFYLRRERRPKQRAGWKGAKASLSPELIHF